ncbi:hypothetical protein NW768_007797 [Fusarium equiseti]|uniref:Uncharacterized protein n=1 Tax=Fusarium equiseti TaxID=61235 RepID=A0ABQ8R8J3_FUSEQ|nr:hypothetical protein NW768_007797 [Fusarium equiseti]
MTGQDEVVITALHRDLRRKYERDFQTIEKVWLVANQAKRQQLFEGCTHPFYEPEQDWNVADITEDEDLFPRMFTWRATASLENQFYSSLNSAQVGDVDAVDKDELAEWARSPNYYEGTYIYTQDELYGETLNVDSQLMDDCTSLGYSPKLDQLVKRWHLMPRRLVGVVLRRQVNILYCLNALVDKILDTEKALCLMGSARYAEEDRTPTLQGPDQEYHAGSIGRDIFDVTYTKVRSLAFWRSVRELLNLLNYPVDNRRILEEVHQLCHQQCEIAKGNVMRQIAMGVARGRFYYDVPWGRFIDTYRGEWALKDVHIHYLIDLCTRVRGPDMTICQLRKLNEFYERKPHERNSLTERESEALHELCTILAFYQDFKTVFPEVEDFCPLDMMDNLLFKQGLKWLDRDVEQLQRIRFPHVCDIKIRDLKEPFKANLALDELRVYVKQMLGTSIGNLYRDQVFDMIEAVQSPELIPFSNILEPDFETRVKARRVREAERLLLPSNVAAPRSSSGRRRRRRSLEGSGKIPRSEIAKTLLGLFNLFDKDLSDLCAGVSQMHT